MCFITPLGHPIYIPPPLQCVGTIETFVTTNIAASSFSLFDLVKKTVWHTFVIRDVY